MIDERRWYAGVDWASESHHVFLTDENGRRIGEKIFRHSGEGLAEMAVWLSSTSGGVPAQIHIAIEVPHGPVVETLIERGFKVHAINPKQMDRFRDRFTLAGAKDDSRDAEVMASALRTDLRCFDGLPSPIPSSLNCGSGRALPTILAPSATALQTACANSSGAIFRRCSISKAISERSGCSTCGRSRRRPTKQFASERRRSPRS